MYSSRNKKQQLIISIYDSPRTVFTLADLALLSGETSFDALNQRIHSCIKEKVIYSPRSRIYVKKNYNKEELICRLYTPSYVSLNYILQKNGIIFQYDPTITAISYISRKIKVDDYSFQYQKIKNELLLISDGITMLDNGISIASSERAIVDTLYLSGETYFDHLNSINPEILLSIANKFNSKILLNRIKKLIH